VAYVHEERDKNYPASNAKETRKETSSDANDKKE
jgi:hypothetical protein